MPSLILNEDNSHFFGTRDTGDMTLNGLRAFIAQYAGTAVTYLFLCPNAMRASFRSAAREAIWDPAPNGLPQNDEHGAKWVANARLLHERGLDPYAVWIAEARVNGISPWLSMRMNDVHNVDALGSFMHSSFWREHPEWRLVPELQAKSWFDRALNYAVPQVRQHAMSFLEELLERYDPDGVELDWMRFGVHFRRGEEAEGAEILTEFMRNARRLVSKRSKERGHVIKLGARVPTHPDAAKGLGMDGVRWAQERLVDMLVPAPFWATSDFDMPVEFWRERIGRDGNILLAPCLEYNLRAYPSAEAVPNDLASALGFAASAWSRGADAVYLFNWMDSETRPVSAAEYRILLEEGLGPDIVCRRPRRHVQTYRDAVPEGFDAGVALPAVCGGGATAKFRIHTGPVAGTGQIRFVAGLAAAAGAQDALLMLLVNGCECRPMQDAADVSRFPGAARVVQFDCPVAAMRDGYNEAELRLARGAPQQIVWSEFDFAPSSSIRA